MSQVGIFFFLNTSVTERVGLRSSFWEITAVRWNRRLQRVQTAAWRSVSYEPPAEFTIYQYQKSDDMKGSHSLKLQLFFFFSPPPSCLHASTILTSALTPWFLDAVLSSMRLQRVSEAEHHCLMLMNNSECVDIVIVAWFFDFCASNQGEYAMYLYQWVCIFIFLTVLSCRVWVFFLKMDSMRAQSRLWDTAETCGVAVGGNTSIV